MERARLFNLRVSDDERAMLDVIATEADVSASVVIRRFIRAEHARVVRRQEKATKARRSR